MKTFGLFAIAVLAACVSGQGDIPPPTIWTMSIPVPDDPLPSNGTTTTPPPAIDSLMGEVDQHIINGRPAAPGAHPYACNLQFRRNGRWSLICGAAIFNEINIITAAHCVDSGRASDFRVRCGDPNRRNNDGTEQTRAIVRIKTSLMGEVDQHIINGRPAAPGAHPYACNLQFRRNGRWSLICGAAIFNEINIITAAHCVDSGRASDFRVRCGDPNRRNNDGTEQTRAIVRIKTSLMGEVDQHIINGRPAAPGAHPYACNLQFRRNGRWSLICGAAIFNEINIITAAHCVDSGRASDFRVRCGDPNHRNNDGTEQTRAIVRIKTSLMGEVDQHIINGRPAAPGAHPYACNLQFRRNGRWSLICGAAIFNEINIITAAHCVDSGRASDFRVRCGDPNRRNNDGTEQTRAIVRIKTSLMGEVDQHIINGRPAAPGGHPYACNLQFRRNGRWSLICGAAIFNEINIITAAHCVDSGRASDFRVRCGDPNRRNNDGTEQTRAIVRIKTHPRWSNNPNQGFPNDIALLRMASPLRFNSFVNNLPLATRTTRLPRSCTIVGYGITETGRISLDLREASTNRLSGRQCQRFWGRYINGGHICFLDNDRSLSSACNGDSGGPANCGGFLAGITSWGASGCPPNSPSVYTKISAYTRWIRTNAFT